MKGGDDGKDVELDSRARSSKLFILPLHSGARSLSLHLLMMT